MKFTEEVLEQAIIELLGDIGYPHITGDSIEREPEEVLIKDDMRKYLSTRYASDKITSREIDSIIRTLETLPASDLYDSNRQMMKMISDGFYLKRDLTDCTGSDRDKQDIYIELIDYSDLAKFRQPDSAQTTTIVSDDSDSYGDSGNIYKVVNQMEIVGFEKRIPDTILYINGLPVVVMEFKSAIREEATIHDAYVQLTTRYRRDIPELFKYNAFCVISDGVNNKMGSFFAPYEFLYSWRSAPNLVLADGSIPVEREGIESLYTMIAGAFDKRTLCDIIRNFIFLPDRSQKEEKIVCRYPQYYAATKLYANILKQMRPHGDGKGGTYFGATGCGKSFTMLFLTRLLMKSLELSNPTIILITDRTDLDDQLSEQFTKAKGYIGDETVISIESRQHLRELLQGRKSGGVFLTTIHKFEEDINILSDRNNIICISDEAHRSQVNLDQKVTVTADSVKKSYGFAKYLHDSLPNATYVGFTGTPIDATLDVFGEVVDAYTMNQSVKDEITVKIVYEGRAAKVLLNNRKLEEIEAYYKQCAEEGSNARQIEKSKKATASMNSILGDSDRIDALADDFVKHYEKRVEEGATLKGKALFVSSSRAIAYEFYKAVIALRPEWAEVKVCSDGVTLSDIESKKVKPMAMLQMIMTRDKDDDKALYDMLGDKAYRKELDRQFKNEKSNFKIAIVVDMWLTGFDVPFLDTIYIDKPIQRHNLIQTISRVNRKFAGKEKGLVVDYIGIKTQMNKALKLYDGEDKKNVENINQAVVATRNQLDLLNKLYHQFDQKPYFEGGSVEQLQCLNLAAEFAMLTKKGENRFMGLVKRLKASYDICCGSEQISQSERDLIHFYFAVRTIIYKLNTGGAPDTAQMNARVRAMISEALESNGVQEIFKMGENEGEVDLFSEDYLNKVSKIKLPLTKMKLLHQLLSRSIDELKKVNKIKGVDFSKKFKALVERYNERKESDVLVSQVLDDFTDELIDLFQALKVERDSFGDLGIDFEEKAFYDILLALAQKYDFEYPEDKLLHLAKAVKVVVDDKAKYTDWSERTDIKAELKVDLIILLAENGYPPVDRDEVYKEIFEQAENFKKYQNG